MDEETLKFISEQNLRGALTCQVRINKELLAALEEMLEAEKKPFHEIVAHDEHSNPLNALGLARKHAREAIAKAKGEIK